MSIDGEFTSVHWDNPSEAAIASNSGPSSSTIPKDDPLQKQLHDDHELIAV